MRHNRKVLAAIKAIKGLTELDTKYGIMAYTKHFNIRVLEWNYDKNPLPAGELRWRVQFSYRKTFDRWSNSANFETTIWYHPNDKNKRYPDGRRRPLYTIPDMNLELKWCKKVAESGLFHWNTYFYTIETPWFIYPDQYYGL